MAERDVVAKIKKYLTTVPDCFFWKEHGGMYGTAGIPDIIACIRGHFFGFEGRRRSGKSSNAAGQRQLSARSMRCVP